MSVPDAICQHVQICIRSDVATQFQSPFPEQSVTDTFALARQLLFLLVLAVSAAVTTDFLVVKEFRMLKSIATQFRRVSP